MERRPTSVSQMDISFTFNQFNESKNVIHIQMYMRLCDGKL